MNLRTLSLAFGLLGAAALGGCSTYTASYSSVSDAGYRLPTIPIYKVPEKYHRQIVDYDTKQKPGTIIVDTNKKFLYFVMPDGKAMRYGIGVGRQGFQWSGVAHIGMKREWPTWTPPAAMIRREPKLAKYRGGMDPGLTNPLGARAMYLFNSGGDMGYRIHGSPEWWSIGHNVSSGCIRLMNQDVMDLYDRAKVGAKVIVER